MSREQPKERETTDPITHLPLCVHDHTDKELENIPPHPDQDSHSDDIHDRREDSQNRHGSVDAAVNQATIGWWGDPAGAHGGRKLHMGLVASATAGLGSLIGVLSSGKTGILVQSLLCLVLAVAAGVTVSYATPSTPRDSAPPQSYAAQKNEDEKSDHESATWFNHLLTSLWPIVNPSLFVSVVDMLEDAMQASTPKLIHGVRVVDIGQGSEPVRIIALRALKAGNADRDTEDKDATSEEATKGLEAEEGDFVNLEIAVAYRAPSSTTTSLKSRSKNAHLMMEFHTVGGLILPVWVELKGILATVRVRLQLTPNPPFISLLTLTFLGQPKIDIKCTPISKSFLNVMDIPGLAAWVQSSLIAAMEDYVAPRSVTFDLKTILTGREQMDTVAHGVLVITVRSAEGFKQGDAGKVWLSEKNKAGDGYVTIAWAKWGKPLWATRIIQREGNPIWEETATILVGPAEISSQERLQLQLWDSDRMTADDRMGTVEVPLDELMSDSTKNQISQRKDPFIGEDCPGTLTWDVAYYPKVELDQHLSSDGPSRVEEMKERIEEETVEKLKEADDKEESAELEQQKEEDFKDASDEVVADTSPNPEWPSGILSIKIIEIRGLEVEKVQDSGVKEETDDGDDDMPSAYCTVIVNHQRVYKTRTKLKSNKPYFDASTERFVPNWQDTTVIVAVRDARTHETDPLLGIVYLPLSALFKSRSQVTDSYPLVGGLGYGRIKLAFVFRAVQAKLPRELLGWDVGTIEITPMVKASLDLPPDLATCTLLARTLYGRGKFRPHADGGWQQKQDRPVRVAVNKRYASCLLVQFRKHKVGPDSTTAFATLWLKDIPDNEEITVTLPVRMNEDDAVARARANTTDEIGERVGTIDLHMRFWPGMSGYHEATAKKNPDVAKVMEVLDCAEESHDLTKEQLDYGDSDSDSSSSMGDDVEDDEDEQDGESEHPGGNGIIGQVKDLNKRKHGLHRKHRGLMQWEKTRNVGWIKHEVGEKVNQAKTTMKARFTHQSKGFGVDHEV